jgi:hypothetical protein
MGVMPSQVTSEVCTVTLHIEPKTQKKDHPSFNLIANSDGILRIRRA